jgi:hypothetical protein
MWPTLISLWRDRSDLAQRKSAPRRRPAYKLTLEWLEDRLAPATLTVNTTADNTTDISVLTLRDAITLVNNAGNPVSLGQSSMPAGWAAQINTTNPFGSNDAINFNIAPSGMQTITVTSALPPISHPAVIDGTSELGWSRNTLPVMGSGTGDNAVWTITLDGSSIGSIADGLEITAGNSTVQGLVIQNCSTDIHLTTHGNDVIAGNSLMAGGYAVFIDNVAGNTVGGTTPGTRNVIGGCGAEVYMGPGAMNNRVQGDYIGTDGTQMLPGSGIGVEILSDTSNNVVGGTGIATQTGNVIEGSEGINFGYGGNVTGTIIEGNYIGPNAAGTAIPPGVSSVQGRSAGGPGNGITEWGGTSNSIITGKVISGWSNSQVYIGAAETNNVVEGNYIGTDATGASALRPNTVDPGFPAVGVWASIVIGTALIGGGLGAGNIIAFNTGAGVFVDGGGADIEGNSIYANGGLGIDLGGDGVTTNDSRGHVGPNNWQNFPVLTSAVSSATDTQIQGPSTRGP